MTKIKNAFFFFALFFGLFFAGISNVYSATSVISEMENTFKRTRGESFRGFYNSVLSHKVFGSMDTLAKEVKGELYFVSDQYSLFNFNTEELVEEFGIKPKEIVSREAFKYDSDYSYKYAVYKRIIESSEDQFILVGSDKGVDQEVFAQIKKEFPKRVLKMYIHIVENRKNILEGMAPYHTAFDIALSEYSDGRMSRKSVQKIGKSIGGEEKFHKVFPHNAHCPRELDEITTKESEDFKELIGLVTKKTLDFCNS